MTELSDPESGTIIRSVSRAFHLLEHLSELGSASIGLLSDDLKLPKPTIVRMIRTLVAEGYVHQSSKRGDYRITSKLRGLGADFTGLPAVLEAATGIADQLTDEVLWPVSIAERVNDIIIVRYSTIPTSPYAHARSTVGKRLPLWTSAHGKAWLAHMEPDHMPTPPACEPDSGQSAEALLAALSHVHEAGYAMRSFGRDPTTNSIAVPIIEQNRVVATLGMTFFVRSLSAASVAEMGARLRRAADQIAAHLNRANAPRFGAAADDVLPRATRKLSRRSHH
jgi:IclR family mhp operon transcriptional activator